jgi:hypothetical protein
LFNPSLEIQTTDNYIDWTSLTVVDLESIVWSSRSIPAGTESDIDVATMSFKTPIYISAPIKVKRLGVITNIITSIFDETRGIIDLGISRPILNAYDDSIDPGVFDVDGNRGVATPSTTEHTTQVTSHRNYGVFVEGSSVSLMKSGVVGQESWRNVLDTYPGVYEPDISRIYLRKLDSDNLITGTFALNELDETKIVVNWDEDSFPDDTVISGRTTIDYIIDPTRVNPSDLKTNGLRVLLLGSVGSVNNTDGPDAWKNTNGTDFVADENDIIEWNGSSWVIVFDASVTNTITYTTNLNTGIQYRWNGTDWLLSIEGEYPAGSWRVSLDG